MSIKDNALDASFFKKTPIIFVVLSLIFFAWHCHEMRETSLKFLDKDGVQHVLSLPLKDKKRLFCFMRMLVAEDNFAYTLLGSKPVSWACYKNLLPLSAENIETSLFLDSCPSFAGDPYSEESLMLKEDYLLTKEKVVSYYKDKDFLEATLSLLAGFRPI